MGEAQELEGVWGRKGRRTRVPAWTLKIVTGAVVLGSIYVLRGSQ